MNFAIPRDDNSEMLLYIWKIIDIPFILIDDLYYRITFDLFLFPPTKAKIFIENCVQNKLLVKGDNNYLKLSEELNQKLKDWQKERKKSVLEKINSSLKIRQLRNDIIKNDSVDFTILINAFTDKGTLNRSVTVSNAAFESLEYDEIKGIINSKVTGTKEESYIIELDTNNKILRHNCHDFETRRAQNKKFCKHLVKLFLLLKEKDPQSAEFFLSQLAKEIDKWDFIT